MKKLLLLSLLTLSCAISKAQTMSPIWANVDTLAPSGALGAISISSTSVVPVAFTSPCATPSYNFAVATPYQLGKVIAISHESILNDATVNQKDNLIFTTNSIGWLGATKKRISFKNGYISTSNTKILQANLSSKGYTFTTQPNDITASSLTNIDILIIGNDWNGNSPYLQSEITAIKDFVAKGGGLMIIGLGWSYSGNVANYPMNQVASNFGFQFTDDIIYDNIELYKGTPTIHDFDKSANTVCYPKYVNKNFARGETLRVLKLAVSVTGEITTQNGGVEAVKQKVNTWVEGLNEIFGREYAIRFELVANNDKLIYTNAQTDPWPTVIPGEVCASSAPLLAIQKQTFDTVLGVGTYDISHIMADLSGGCAGTFDAGATGGISIGIGRHEVGHQFGQVHTINNPSAINYEHEDNGGWTIHGGNGYPYAHAVTYHQTIYNLLNQYSNKGTNVATGNTVPSVNAGSDYFIPISTPFKLSASASDLDAGDKLTYVWDNMNPWFPIQTVPSLSDTVGILFGRFLPDVANTRTFPRMSDIIANRNVGQYEQLPTKPRFIDMRLTVNDNHKMNYNDKIVNASGINSDDIRLTVVNAGPFVVTSQSTKNITYSAGTTQQITWQVNGTNLAPINAFQVKISLSLDGGYTYPIVLLASTPNNGAATVTIPLVSTLEARIKVEAVGNIFFDLNTENFKIVNTSCDLTTQMTVNTGTAINTNRICVKDKDNVLLGLSGTYDANWKFTYTRSDGQTFAGGIDALASDELSLKNLQGGGVESGSWLINYTGPNGCVNTESFFINVKTIVFDKQVAVYGSEWQPTNIANTCAEKTVLLNVIGTFDNTWSITYSRPNGQVVQSGTDPTLWLFDLKDGGLDEGTWKVKYTDLEGCSNTENFVVNVNPIGSPCDTPVTSIDKTGVETGNSISIYPNPVNSNLHLSEATSWKLIDFSGKVLLSGEGNVIECASLHTGIYILKTDKLYVKVFKQ